MENVVDVKGLTRRYGDFCAVDGLDLVVTQGECLAVLGPNGAGKTTTIEILEGYRHRDAGDVHVLGVDPATADRRWRARLGIVLQSASDLGDLTVRESIQHFARFYSQPRLTSEVLDITGLTDKSDARNSSLSGGQRRRLDVALGIVGRPELLFLDEPTTGFDPEARQVFWQLIHRLKSEGTTIVLTTHYLEEADALADRVVVIARGRKVADTTPALLGRRTSDDVRVSWWEENERRDELTRTPTAFIASLSQRLGGEIPHLEVSRPTLEQAYLELLDEGERS